MAPTAGEPFPDGIVFKYIPYTPEAAEFKVCGIPINYNASKEWANKKVVLFALPGAFTPTCSADHLPGYIKALPELRAKGVDVVAVLAHNDPFVMSGWGKAYGVKNDDILFLSDDGVGFSKKIGWNVEDTERSVRYAIIIDHGKFAYAAREEGVGASTVTVSGHENILKHL